jgi:hypothetical protein
VPSFDGGEDFVGIFGPGEGRGILVGVGQESMDGGFQLLDGPEDAAFEALFGELCEEAFDGVEPRCRGRGEVEDEARMAIEPFHDLGVLVRGIIVDDGMDRLFSGDIGIDGVEEADELLMAMTLHALPEDVAFEDVEGGKEGSGAVALVIVGHGSSASFLHRQAGLSAVERLNLALLVDREHDGMVRRIDVEPDDVMQLGGELRIVGELELANAMRLQTMGTPDALNRTDADPDRGGHGWAGPMSHPCRWPSERQGDHALRNRRIERRDARGARLVAPQTGGAFGAEPLLPAPDDGLGLAGALHDLVRPVAGSRQQDDLGAPNVLLRAVPVRHDRLEIGTVRGTQMKLGSRVHTPDSHVRPRSGIHKRIEPLEFIH